MKFKNGFTLIEMLAAIGAFSLILPAVFGIFIGILQEQARFIALRHVKSEAEHILYSIKNTIKTRAVKTCKKISGGYDCTQSCTDGDTQDSFYFQDTKGNLFRFFLENNKIASESVNVESNANKKYYLSSDLVKIEEPNILTCKKQGESTLINIDFNLRFKTSIGGVTPKMKYNTKVLLMSQ